MASRLKPEFLKGQRAYLVATSCYLPPKEDFVHKTFLINAIRKSVSLRWWCRGLVERAREMGDARSKWWLVSLASLSLSLSLSKEGRRALMNFNQGLELRYLRAALPLSSSADVEERLRGRHREEQRGTSSRRRRRESDAKR